jgi:hypothetical protein
MYLFQKKQTLNDPVLLHATIGFNSCRLAERVKEKFGLTDWEIKSVNYDEGDDTNLEKTINGSFNKKKEVSEFLVFVRDLMPLIIGFERIINTCQLCKEKSWELFDHAGRSICGRCEQKIISENIDRYFL